MPLFLSFGAPTHSVVSFVCTHGVSPPDRLLLPLISGWGTLSAAQFTQGEQASNLETPGCSVSFSRSLLWLTVHRFNPTGTGTRCARLSEIRSNA